MGSMVRVYMRAKDEEKLRRFAEQKGLKLSSAGRMLILDQLRYLAWKEKGKPRRKGKKEKEPQERVYVTPPGVTTK